MNLASLVTAQAVARPKAPAIIESPRGRLHVTTFAELDDAAQRAAAMLRKAGLREGDAVLVFQPMSAELYVALLALFRLGATAMFLDPSAGAAHLEACCELQPPRALVASARAHLLRLRSRALRRIPLKFTIGLPVPGAQSWGGWRDCAPLDEAFPVTADTAALLSFTSGSTGQPKAAVRTHGFLRAQHRVLERNLALQPSEVDLATLPVFLLANLASGVTSVIPNADLRAPGRIEPGPVLRQVNAHQVTRCAASPAFFERLLEGERAQPGALAGLRKIYTGGAPVFPRLLEALGAAAPDARAEAVYGSTEAEPIAHAERQEIRADDHAAMRGGAGLLAGKPVEEIELRILRDQWGTPLGALSEVEFASRCVPAGEAGEIVVSGEHVLSGYLQGRGDAETKFRVARQVWHRTGDAGRLDAEGRLWLLGRCSARVTDARGSLWPFTVECAALSDPRVRRAALASVGGRRVLAVEGAELEAGDEKLLKSLAWAEIDRLVPVKRLPVDRRHNAKIDYPALTKLLEEANR
jgi:acyl-CoA synthetase (AMP-forming)/AMP-acid ligase II